MMGLLCVISMMPEQVSAQRSGYVLIANESGVRAMDAKEMRDLLMGRASVWPNGNPVILVLPGMRHPQAADYARLVHQSDHVGMQRYWLAQVFQGRSQAPVFLDSTEAIIEFVRSNKGAVGYVGTDGTSIPENLRIDVR